MRCSSALLPAQLSVLVLLAACGRDVAPPVAGNTVDPAIADALADPILVDPQLSGQANTDALRPADRPFSAPVPTGVPAAPSTDAATLATRARDTADTPALRADFAGCDLAVRYGMRWAARLAPGLTLPLGAQVIEAAGSDTARCRLRVVSYATAGTPADTLAIWREAAVRQGYALSASTPASLTARRSRDAATLEVTAQAQDGATTVDVVVNRGS